MASYNRVVLVGNLTRDPELRAIANGSSVANIGLAVNDRKRGQNGEWIEEASFFDVEVWGRSAEILREYTRKGSSILIEGRLKQDVWEQDGLKRSKVKVVAERIVLLSSNAAGSGNNTDNGARTQKSYAPSRPAATPVERAQPTNRGNGYSNAAPAPFSQDMAEDIPF